MSTALLMGVDGGGTSCRVRIADEHGRVLTEARAGSANIRVGVDGPLREIERAARAALAQAGLEPSALARLHVGLGLAGAGVRQRCEELLAQLSAQPGRYASVRIETDALIACRGAHGGRDGGIVIVGTGTCGVARLGARIVHVGGHGFQISDQGSGAVMGWEALRRALLAHEEIRPATPFSRTLMDLYANDPERLLLWAITATPSDYAALAPTLLEHAAANDPLAVEVLDEAVAAVAAILDTLVRLGAPRVCAMGGLAGVMRARLPARLDPWMTAPAGDALDGALLLAREALAGTRQP